MKFRFSKLPRHATFNYRPRYYDPDKERKEELRARYQQLDTEEQLKRRISQGFRRAGNSQYSFRTVRSQQNRASNFRLIGIIIFFFLLAYLLLESNIEGVLEALDARTH